MKHKILSVGIVFLLVATLVSAISVVSTFSGCTQKTTTTTVTTAANTPQTGGSLHLYTQWGFEEPSGFDSLTQRIWSGSVWINPFTEWLLRGDVEKYGPRGNNSFTFQTYETIPEQYLTGELAQTWELNGSPLQITFHLRHGVMFTGNTYIGMTPRELVASDVVFSLKRTIADPGPGSYLGMIKDVTATDTYTVVVSLNRYDANWFFLFAGGMAMGAIQPEEMAAANGTGYGLVASPANATENWRNSVGTGPFILQDYTQGVGATYVKNTNYWGTTTIDGKVYKTPFIDKLYYDVIADPSTRLAALITGKLDWMPNVAMTDQQTINQGAPAMIQNQILCGKVDQWRINRQGSKYLNQKAVRQALMIGTDLQAISHLLYNDGVVVSWPIGPQVPGYTALQDLPQEDQLLYKYDTAKAIQMLTDAGYPKGFTIEIDTDSDPIHTDLANACAEMWSKINIKSTIKVLDATTAASYRDQVLYPDMLYSNYTVVNPLVSLHLVASNVLATNYTASEPFDAMYKACAEETDPAKRTTLEKQLGVAFLDDVGMLSFGQAYVLNCYWPWMKNYYSELDAGYYNQMPMIKTMWIDQNLRRSLGVQ